VSGPIKPGAVTFPAAVGGDDLAVEVEAVARAEAGVAFVDAEEEDRSGLGDHVEHEGLLTG